MTLSSFKTTTTEPALPRTSPYREAFESTAPDREALAPSELAPINIDIGFAVNAVLAAIPRIALLRSEMDSMAVKHALIDKLEAYARATAQANGVYDVATTPPADLEPTYQEALKRRTALRSEVQNLVAHGLVAAESLAGIPGETGYRNVGYDLIGLAAILRNAGDRIKNRTATLPEDWDQAEVVSNRLLDLAARREDTLSVPANVALDRQRAFTLMMRAYDEARRAVTFLRWGEADTIAPSVYVGRMSRRKGGEAELPTPQVEPLPSPAVEPLDATTPIAPGARGGSPFM